jgi:hypothetical protein
MPPHSNSIRLHAAVGRQHFRGSREASGMFHAPHRMVNIAYLVGGRYRGRQIVGPGRHGGGHCLVEVWEVPVAVRLPVKRVPGSSAVGAHWTVRHLSKVKTLSKELAVHA